jgi:DNA-binding MarR family transcriptional regulator
MASRPRRTGRGRVAPRVDYGTLADLRYEIRRFLRVRETAARAAGLEPQQYLVLLQVKGLTNRRSPTIGLLAERLQVRHHSAVELVDRLVERGLVARQRASEDRRLVMVTLRPAGEAVLRRLALLSLTELRQAGPRLVEVLTRLIGDKSASSARRVRRQPNGGRR